MLSVAKAKLQSDVFNALRDDKVKKALALAFKSTFPDLTDGCDDIADQFGEIAAKGLSNALAQPLTDAIDAYVKEIDIIITPTALVCPVGPVSGAISPSDVQIL